MFGIGEQQPVGEKQDAQQQDLIPFYSQPQASELGKMMLEKDKLIEETRMRLLGKVLVNGEYQQISEPLMNDKGAGMFSLALESHVGKEVYLSDLLDEDVVRIVKDLWKTICKLILINRDKFEIKPDKGTWSLIRSIVIDQAFFALTRGREHLEKEFFRQAYRHSTSTNVVNEQMMKKKFFSGFG